MSSLISLKYVNSKRKQNYGQRARIIYKWNLINLMIIIKIILKASRKIIINTERDYLGLNQKNFFLNIIMIK